jgi:hypothetical protein
MNGDLIEAVRFVYELAVEYDNVDAAEAAALEQVRHWLEGQERFYGIVRLVHGTALEVAQRRSDEHNKRAAS